VYCYAGGVNWDVADALAPLGERVATHAQLATLVDDLLASARAGDQILVMSNGAFGGIHETLLQRLALKAAAA
jgi:UDP-N-acetylmuramate: L-alanyl-gamma-D-glutamyl-meso-diaminopimelate ligase